VFYRERHDGKRIIMKKLYEKEAREERDDIISPA